MDKKEVAFKIIEILENEKVRISDLNDIFGYVTSVVSTTAIAPTTKDIHFPGEIVKCTNEEARISRDRIPLYLNGEEVIRHIQADINRRKSNGRT